MNTITMPKVGDRVRAVCIPHVTHHGSSSTEPVNDEYTIESLEFEVTNVTETVTPPRVYGRFTYTRQGGPSRTESWYVTEWEPITKPMPTIGQKVIPLASDDNNWYGIPEFYRDKAGIVTGIATDHNGQYVTAEFASLSKPDDTVAWSFYNWKPAQDYVPRVGDRVVITGHLSDDGIVDGYSVVGSIRAVDGDIWSVWSAEKGHTVSGPGYVAKAPEIGEDVTPEVVATDVVEEPMVPKRELDRANERVAEYAKRATDWEHDFNHYATEVKQEAIDRNWCDEYERVMGRIRDNLLIGEIPEREQEFEIDVTITGNASTTYTVTVTANSLEDAEARLRDDISSYVDTEEILNEAVRYGNGWDETDAEVD